MIDVSIGSDITKGSEHRRRDYLVLVCCCPVHGLAPSVRNERTFLVSSTVALWAAHRSSVNLSEYIDICISSFLYYLLRLPPTLTNRYVGSSYQCLVSWSPLLMLLRRKWDWMLNIGRGQGQILTVACPTTRPNYNAPLEQRHANFSRVQGDRRMY